jgi:hypothetical protein
MNAWIYTSTPNTPSLRAGQLKKHRDNFTFTFKQAARRRYDMWSGGIAPCILKFGKRWKRVTDLPLLKAAIRYGDNE